jgi:uncharacterized protein RhaS with RHS repeats
LNSTRQPGHKNWLNQDPIGEAGGLSLYDYVRNNPINYFDPSGLSGMTSLGTPVPGGSIMGNWVPVMGAYPVPQTPAGNSQFTLGVNGTVGGNPFMPLFPGLYGGGGTTIGFNTYGQLFAQFQAAGMYGPGLFGGVDFQAGAGRVNYPYKTGVSTENGFHGEANAGWGRRGGAAVDVSANGQGGTTPIPGLDLGMGFGAMAAGGVATTTTISTPPWPWIPLGGGGPPLTFTVPQLCHCHPIEK